MPLARRVLVAGVGMVKVGRHYGRSLIDLAAEAALKAVKDAGIEPQAIVVSNMLGELLQLQANLAPLVAESLGLRFRPSLRVEVGQGSGGAAVHVATAMVASGLAESVLVVGVEKLTDYPTATVVKASTVGLDAEYEAYYGVTPAAIAALAMRTYMERYGVSRDEMSEWPVMMHSNAAENPYAQIRKRISREDVAKSQVVADPITMLDSHPIGDGAAAILLASEEAAREAVSDPKAHVEVAAVVAVTDTLAYGLREEPDRIPSARLASEKAYQAASLEPRDVDVVELHDDYTVTGIVLLEELGFAERGRAAKQLAEGRFHPGDKPTVNPSGGLKARGHPYGATGVYQVAEVALQLREEFPGVKVRGAEVGLALSLSGYGAEAVAVVLRRI
jgi:acetyl-CoA C-acetyltransferase/acetyl-CoA acyltransferase